MNKNLKSALKIAIGIAGAAIPAVSQVEHGIEVLKSAKGKAKQDAALELVKSSLEIAEQAAEKDLLNDPEVETATRSVMDAIVALQNVLVKKQPAGA